MLNTRAPVVKALHKLQVAVDQANNAALELDLVLHDVLAEFE